MIGLGLLDLFDFDFQLMLIRCEGLNQVLVGRSGFHFSGDCLSDWAGFLFTFRFF
jgi:hypothetical protein